ncbi:hypothetical protein ACKC9G_00185 [Pokkaliibacter sp. CJK22405]|uniref:hypothetical protein n=1 Tax=Pokkaliibacter sp. CJK22405 TaxID=3384615 RepID=UPI0039855716
MRLGSPLNSGQLDVNPSNHLNSTHAERARQAQSPTLTQQDKEKLCELYETTYAKIGGEVMSKEEFMSKLDGYYDKVVTQRGHDNQIKNALACWEGGNPNGTKICLVFGEEGKEAAQERLQLLKDNLSQPNGNFYLHANKAVASALLKDRNVNLAMMLEPMNDGANNHYYSVANSHGKKLVFGNCKDTQPVSHAMKSFYIELFEYNKTKLAIEKAKDPSVEDNNQLINRLVKNFDDTLKSDMPLSYKSILGSKILKKALGIQGDFDHRDKVDDRVYVTLDLLSHGSSKDLTSLFNMNISTHEKQLLAELLDEKIEDTHRQVSLTQMTKFNPEDPETDEEFDPFMFYSNP